MMKTKTPDEIKKLKGLLKVLRANGVRTFSQHDGGYSLELNDTLPAQDEPAKAPKQSRQPEFPDLDLNDPESLQLLMSSAR